MSRVITIDGPAGVGKGTISKLLSHYLNAEILNSGEIYRTITYNIIKHKINQNDISSIIEYVKSFDYKPLSSNKLYNKNIDLVSSKISSISELRKLVVKIQIDFTKLDSNTNKLLIAEGRDMGTAIFPKAKIKIFLWANSKIRAQRRYQQIKKAEKNRKFDTILEEIKLRDFRDMSRKIAPLQPAEDSYLIDNSNLDIEQCFNKILKIIKKNKII
ncbi:(d)CMP kinase [Pelagibacteraceae bacterium]|jgi:cytidylate kinase|nr:(d)CMP kinase [Pelagibacteraceae bacterium]